jgi:hypothetical protein
MEPQCNMQYESDTALLKHWRDSHDSSEAIDGMTHRFGICNRGYVKKHSRDKHQIQDHCLNSATNKRKQPKVSRCLCKRVFRTPLKLTNHICKAKKNDGVQHGKVA